MLLLCAGMGFGFTAAAHIRDCQRQLHSLSRLFGYLAELLNAQALAGPELLHRAARCPEFADFCPAGAAALADLQLPSCLPEALRCEALQTLRSAEESPRLTAWCGAAQAGRTLRGGGLQPGRAVPCRPAALAPAGGLSGRTDRHFAVVRSGLMDIDLVFKIAATGIIVAVLNQLLIRSGREDQAMMTTLAGLIVVLTMLVRQISDLFVLIKALFEL